MDYGDIFVSTFRTIWQHKVLWLFGMVGRLIVTLVGIVSGLLTLRLLPTWFSFVEQLSTGAIPNPGEIPTDLGTQLGSLWAGLCCVAILGYLANYVVSLIMRGATIGEAAIAWSGQATDTGRGLRTGAGRALHLFAIDVLWWVPIWLIVAVVAVGGFVSLVGIASTATGGSNQGGTNASILLLCCGLPCCLVLLGLAVAVIAGTFSPLMYQSAVQNGRLTLGQAIAEGWRLARTHWGTMFVLWLLLTLLWIAGGVLLAAISYPFSAATSGGLAGWFTTLAQDLESGVPVAPAPLPPANTGLFAVSTIVEAIIGLLVYGFLQTFGRTMYAQVYRRLAGAGPAPTYAAPGRAPIPGAGYPAAPAPVAPDEIMPAPESYAAEPGARVYDRPDDLGLSVPDEPPADDESRPAL